MFALYYTATKRKTNITCIARILFPHFAFLLLFSLNFSINVVFLKHL